MCNADVALFTAKACLAPTWWARVCSNSESPRELRRLFTLRRWSHEQEIKPFSPRGASTDERERVKALEREVKELRRANEILKLASAFFAQAELDRRLKS